MRFNFRLFIFLAFQPALVGSAFAQRREKAFEKPPPAPVNMMLEGCVVPPAIQAEDAITRLRPVGGGLDEEGLAVDNRPTDWSQPFTVVEQQAQFPGDVRKWIVENTRYPPGVGGMEGRVVVRFIVELDGSLSNVQIMRGISPALDAEALRLVHSMPCWKPGQLMGKLVRSYYSLPIRFYLQG